mgnify:FL=1
MKKRLIIVDGGVGAGKTTFIRNLAIQLGRYLKVVVVDEPVDRWVKLGILEKFYADPLRYAYEFQTCTFTTRTDRLLKALETPADLYVLERSILTDRFVFMELQNRYCPAHETNMYNEWWPMWTELLKEHDVEIEKMIYLKPSLSSCMARVRSRNRSGEVPKAGGGVSESYQMDLQKVHECFLEGKHSGDFPDMPARPFPLIKVMVVGPELADGDFRPPKSEAILTTANKIMAQLSVA